jgi:hypothetical protein
MLEASAARDRSVAKQTSLSFAEWSSPQTQQVPCLRRLGQGSWHLPQFQLRHGTSVLLAVEVTEEGETARLRETDEDDEALAVVNN